MVMFQRQYRDEAQHIAKILHPGNLPVHAVATVSHGPDDEGTSPHRRSENDRSESSASGECPMTDTCQGVRESKGGESGAGIKRIIVDADQ